MALKLEEAPLRNLGHGDLCTVTAGIAHDLNNLLMAIAGNLLMVRDLVPASVDIRKYLDNADKAVLRSKELTSRLSRVSKADVGTEKQGVRSQTVLNDQGKQDAFQGRSILLMDDDQSVWNVAGYMLKRLGYAVTFSGDGENAVALYRKSLEGPTPFDAVVLDLTVDTGSGGVETLKNLAQIDPAVKAIISSGDSNDPVMAQSKKYGFAAALCKPYGIEELSRVLAEVING